MAFCAYQKVEVYLNNYYSLEGLYKSETYYLSWEEQTNEDCHLRRQCAGQRLFRAMHSHAGNRHEISIFRSGKAFLEKLYKGNSFDLLFLDIQMPGEDGWEIAREIKKSIRRLFIAMVTIHADYIFDCFDRVDWFAVKPVTAEQIMRILNKAQEQLFPTIFEFASQNDRQPILLNAAEILCMEARRNSLMLC